MLNTYIIIYFLTQYLLGKFLHLIVVLLPFHCSIKGGSINGGCRTRKLISISVSIPEWIWEEDV
jgi:hypothetical protein